MKSPLMPLWALVGPTAAGKSARAMAVAKQLGAEIISVDAVQVYRGFDIGSAKPTPADQAEVRHHGLDVVGPTEPFNAQHFVDLAERAIAEIRARNRIPLLCGGTGLYLRALRYGLVDAPTDPSLRAQLIEADVKNPGISYRQLTALDPQSAAAIEPRNGTYVRRALEICILTGQTAHAIRAQHQASGLRQDVRLVVLDTEDATLRDRIAERTQVMLQGGLQAEVEAHLAAGLPPTCRPMQAVGYKEMTAHLQGRLPQHVLYKSILASTWNYVRRQRIWLRRERRLAPEAMLTVPQGDLTAQVAWLTALWSKAPPPLAPRPGGGDAPGAAAAPTTDTKGATA